MAKILIVDDEERMLDLLSLYLAPHHYECKKATSGMEALMFLQEEQFDLILLDVMMPGMDGWQTCKEIRLISDIPIIMVSARDQKPDIVKGLQVGADDYVTKPFDEQELLARIEAILRRTANGQQVNYKDLIWDGDKHELTYRGKHIRLTPKEFSMIGLFLKYPERVFSREQLIELIWGFDSETEGRTIDSHVRNIRDKIRQVGFPIDEHFKTVWGIGYKWEK